MTAQSAAPIASESLGAWLLSMPPGSVTGLVGTDIAAVRGALAGAEVPADRRIGLVYASPDAAAPDAVVEAAADALAAMALSAFPGWFGTERIKGIGGSSLERTLLDQHLRAIREAVAELSPFWARHAVVRASHGRLPRVREVPLAVELRQLALALNRGALTLIPVLSRRPGAPEAASAQRGLEFLAGHSGAAVVAVVPGPMEDVSARFDRVPCAELAAPCVTAAADDVPDGPWAGPIEGRPHWASSAEQSLAKALAEDRELQPLFACNQTVVTRRGGRPRVDLLWRSGRLIVEIDGYPDHTTREAFQRDRHRDYELIISGYLVLRLTAEEVLRDPHLSLDKLRDAVRFRTNNETWEPD